MINIYFMNFLLAMATTIAMTVTPIITTETLGLSITIFALIEGSTELIASILKILSGNIFDNAKNKKNIFIYSTIFGCLSKFLLFIPSSITILSTYTLDRISNGLFGAPRDAYVGHNAESKGLALAILNCTKTLGCALGPAIVAFLATNGEGFENQLYKIISCCLACSFIALLFAVFLKTKSRNIFEKKQTDNKQKFCFQRLREVTKNLSPIFLIAGLFFSARFNYGMIPLFFKEIGLPAWFYLSTLSIFNLIIFIISPLLGMLVDNKGAKICLYIAIISLLAFNLTFYLLEDSSTFIIPILGLIFWASQRAASQIAFSAMIFNIIPKSKYGTAIGIYSCINGAGMFLGSLVCGCLAKISIQHIFIWGIVVSVACLVVTMVVNRWQKKTIKTNY